MSASATGPQLPAPEPLDLEALARELGLTPDDGVDTPQGKAWAALLAAQDGGVFDVSDEDAAALIAEWLDDPEAFARDVFGAVPDEWQHEAFECVRRKLPTHIVRVALKACKGPGKSCWEAWMIWWALACHVDANLFAISITRDNLRDGLWKELAVWYAKSAWLQREFKMDAQRITHRESPKTWWCAARAFAQDADPTQQKSTLAGLHAKSLCMIVCDESSDYPDGVMGAAEGIVSNAGVDGMRAIILQAGNPTRSAGPLFDACTRRRSQWEVVTITGDPDDPKRSQRINIEYARDMIREWGRDDPVVMVNILGEFPKTPITKLLGPDDILKAEKRDAPPRTYLREPVIWGLDCARFGTDRSVLRKRQGPIAFKPHVFRRLDGPQLAEAVSFVILKDMERNGGRRPDYIFVDVTGLGSSPFDHLKLLGWGDVLVPVESGGKPDDTRYADKRAEMWDRMARWIKKEGCLPSGSNQLAQELCEPNYLFRKRANRTCFVLESKEDLRARGVASPDEADALAFTFFHAMPLRRDYMQNQNPAAVNQHVGRCVTRENRFKRGS